MLVEFEGAIHEFPDDFTDKDISAALKSIGKPPAAAPPSPRPSGLLDRLTAGLAEGIKASGAESDLMTAAGGPVELPSLTDAGTSLARGITSGMMTVPELGAKLLGDAADQEKYKAARLGMAYERAEAKKNYGIGGKVLLDMLEGVGSLVATLPVDILTGGLTKELLMADRVARLFSPMLKGVIEASPGFALGMAGRGALTEAADREYDPLTRAARTVAGGVEGLTLGKLFETAMGVGKGLDLPGRLAAQLGVQTPLGVGMAGMEAAKEGRMPTVEELASGAGMGAGFGIFGALKGKPKLDTEALNDFKYERDMFRSELADRVREFAGDRMSDAEADAFTRAFESAELKKQNITEPSAEDYRRGRENLANISEAMRQGFNRERGLNLLEPPGGLKAEGVLSNPIAAEAILRGNKPPRIEADETALGVNAALERLLQEMGREKALPAGQGFELKDEPAMSRFSPELAALVRQLSGRAALPSGERGFELQGKAYDPIERFLRDLIAKDRERKALPPPPREGEGFTFSDSTDSPKTMLRKGEPSWTAGRLPEEGELQVDYKPRLTRGGTPFKSVATAQAAINKLGLQDSFVVVPVEGGYGLKRAGTSPKPSAGEIVEPGATSGGVGQEVPESDRVTGGGAVPGRSDRIKTAAGTPVDIQYAVVPADSLIASHDTAMRINKNYPASLQPRDRTRAASDVQVSGIAKKLDPNFLGESYDAGTGAPIVGKDLVVESGNGRVIAVKMAYENIPDKAAAYREWLGANAEKFGVDRAAIGKMKNPVLVRVRTTPVDRVAFSREANEAGVAAMSAVEQAKVDAAKMKPGLMDLLDAGEAGDLTAAANRDFVRGFLEAVVSPSERGRYLTKDGLVSQEGVNRMRNAVFARAYGESQALSLLSEATDSNIRNITNSLVSVAGKMSRLDDMIKEGKRHPLSISQAIGQAADKMSTLRQQGMSVDAYLKQGAMFDDGLTDQAKGLLWVFDEFKRSSKALTNILSGYVEQVNKVGDPHQQSLLDNAPIPDYNDLIQRSIIDERAGRQQAVYPDLFEAGVGAAGSAKEASGDRRGVSEARREWDREPAGTAGAAAEREGISSRKRSYGTAQVEIDFEGARPLPDGGGVEYPLVGEAKIGAAKSDYQDEFTSQDAAQIGRDLISKYPQEHLIAIFTDKNGRPVSVMRHVIGGTTSSATYIELIVGKAVNYDAGGIYMVHNHPSGNTRLSDPDMRLFRALGGLLQGTGIEAKDMIAVGPETWGNSQGSNIAFPADAKGKEGIEIPYFERVFASPGKKLTTISGKDDFLRYARKEMPDGGIILLNAVNEVVATMKGLPDYGAIRKAGLRELLGESEKRAAAAMLIYEPNRALSFDDIKNVGAFANAAGLALHDVYTKRGSYREAYGNPQQDVGNIFHEGITSLFSPEAWRRNFIPLAKDLSRAIPRLEALGRFVFDAGKKTAKEWVAAMKSYLGDLWTKFREQLRDIWNNLKAMNRKKGPGNEASKRHKEYLKSINSDLPNPSRPPEVGGQSGRKGPLGNQRGAVNIKPLAPVADALRDFKREIGKTIDEYTGAISTRLGNIDPGIKGTLRKFEYRRGVTAAKRVDRVLPFLKKVAKMPKEDKSAFDLARKNGNPGELKRLVTKYKLGKEYHELRLLLAEMHKEATDVGYDVGFLSNYHPRVLKDTQGFLRYMYRQDDWPILQKAIRAKEEDLRRYLTDEEKAKLVNTMLRGYPVAGISLGKTGQMKAREITRVTPELNKFYMDSDGALLRYISDVTDAVEARKLFGRTARGGAIGNIEDTIGGYILDLLQKGKIKPENERELRDILIARFNEVGTRGLFSLYKNLSYIDTMGSSISAVTQIGDIAWAIYKNGLPKATSAAARALVGGSPIRKEDIGIERIASEFADTGKMARAVDKTFKIIGLTKVDNIGKESLINSTWKAERKKAMSDKGAEKLRKELSPIFEEETEQLIRDLRDGNITDNVKFYLFYVLSDFQPISLSEMPQKYLEAGNGRIFYMLKTFTLKQFDIFRREVFQKIAKRGTRLEGIRNLVWLAASFAAANAGADLIKAVILGRPIDANDMVVDNLLRLFGVSKFVTWKAREEGAGSAMVRQIIPPFKAADALSKDIFGKKDGKGLEITQSIPVVGKLYYWWFGKGAEKSRKKREKMNSLGSDDE